METRLLQAQSENMAPIDLISTLVSDELACRSKRLLERRHKQAQFRDADKRLDNFDFQFNARMNRNLVFELAPANWIGKREDTSFVGPNLGAEKSCPGACRRRGTAPVYGVFPGAACCGGPVRALRVG